MQPVSPGPEGLAGGAMLDSFQRSFGTPAQRPPASLLNRGTRFYDGKQDWISDGTQWFPIALDAAAIRSGKFDPSRLGDGSLDENAILFRNGWRNSWILQSAGSTQLLFGSAAGTPTWQTATGDMTFIAGVATAQPSLVNNALLPMLPGGRLSLTANTPVTTSDVTGATAIHYCTYLSDRVPILNVSSVWKYYAIPSGDISVSLGTLASGGLPFDVFVYLVGTTPTLFIGPNWSTTTTRGTGAGTTQLTQLNGVWVNAVSMGGTVAANQGTYLGTFFPTAVTTTEDSAANRYLFNAYNRVPRPLVRQSSDGAYNYTTATWRQANANTANKVQCVLGLVGEAVSMVVHCMVTSNAAGHFNAVSVGVGVDSTTVNSAQVFGSLVAGGFYFPTTAFYNGLPGIGQHALNWLEYSTALDTTGWLGAAAGTGLQPGIAGTVFA